MQTLTLLATLMLGQLVGAHADSIYTVKLKDIDGKASNLAAYKGQALLIVNVASKCGFTKQYTGLEAIYKKYKSQGMVVLGMPCNQFGGQEPGSSDEIKHFCSSQYSVTFPLFEKLEVNGDKRHPLYSMLAGKDSPVAGDIKWNFTKFLVAKDGKILKRFESTVTPESPELTAAIEAALAAP
ncbi:MAG: glutathione peroxidase [Verrucomicrobia bacterium]|nr:MAG: glutathione peroxidase [Verrucomicrobiota bacterium]